MYGRVLVPLMVVCALLATAGPAQARQSAQSPAQNELQARAAFCVPCLAVAGVLVVRAAHAIRTATAMRKLALVGSRLRPSPRGAKITTGRLVDLRVQAHLIAVNGSRWAMRKWPRFRPFVRACLGGVAALQTTTILKDKRMTLAEWRDYLFIADLGNPNPEVLNLYFDPAFDFSTPQDPWYAACAAGIVAKVVAG